MANNIYTSITRSPSTINRWNRRTFIPERNLFAIGGVQTTGLGGAGGYNFSGYTNSFNVGNGLGFDAGKAVGATGGTSGSSNGGFGGGKAAALQTAAGVGLSLMDSISTGDKRGMWDTLDPVYHLAGGRESGAGNAMSDAGVSLTKAGLQSGQPYMALAGAALKVVGGLTNAAFGIKENKAMKQAVEQGISQNNNFVSRATSFDDVKGPAGVMTNTNVYEGGWFSGGKADRKNAELADRMINAKQWADRSVINNISNIADDQINAALQNYAAFGGPIDIDPSTAIGYSIYTDKFMKDRQKTDSGMTNMFAGTPDIFGFGGGIFTKGANFDTGVSFINKGGSHEENPYEGVQMGVDNQGVPNLVEEGEVRWNDYMFSNRLTVPKGKKRKSNKYSGGGSLAKGKGVDIPHEDIVLKPYEGITFAEAAKKIIKRNGADERDDAITMRGVDAQLSVLAGVQEKERQKEELREMQEAIDNMSPEEFAMLQQYAEQQQAQQQQMENPMFMPQEGQMIPQEAAPMSAFGGQLYALGGPIAKVAKYHNLTEEEWNKLDETAQNNYIRRYQSSLKKADKKSFESEMATYKDNLQKEKELADYREAQKNSTLTKKDIENLSYDQKVKLGKALDPSFDADSYKTLNQREALDDDLVKLSEKNNVTLGKLNETLAAPSDHKNWQIVNPDEAWNRSIDWSTPLYGETTPVPVEAGNTKGHYQPRNWVNKDGKIYVAGLNPNYAESYNPSVVFGKDYAGNLQDYDTFKKYIQDNYDTLNKANTDGTRSGFFDQIAGQMHGTYGTKQARELYQIKGNEGTYLNPEGNWRDNYSIVNTENKDDGTTIYTLDPNAGMYFNRVESTPDNLQVSPEGKITRVGDSYVDEFPKPSNWPFAVAAGLQLGSLGYNILKPTDYSNADALLNASRDAGIYKPVAFRPVGNYLPYRPLDIWYEQNRLNANARATDRAILNSGANQGSQEAALLASGYNNQIASGNLFRQAQEYNDALRKQVEGFNRGTDMFNSEGFLKADMANQDAASRAAGYSLEGKRAAYAMRQAIDDAKANAISAGLSGLGNLAMAYGQNKWNNELLGWKLKHNQYPISQLEGTKSSTEAAKGGKLKRKHRGLGF